jgi:RNA polymerase sigma-32 factor
MDMSNSLVTKPSTTKPVVVDRTTDLLRTYFNDLGNKPLLSRDEEHRLAIKVYNGNCDESRKELITANLRLVVKIAFEYKKVYKNTMDLIQEGNLGLIQAINRFDPFRGVKLSTYAAWWIRAYILKFLMDNKSLVKMGQGEIQRKLYYHLRAEANKLAATNSVVTTKMIAEKIGATEEEVQSMQQRLIGDVSIDTPISEDTHTTHKDLLESITANPEEELEKSEMYDRLYSAISDISEGLSDKEKYIFQHRLLTDDPLTLQEIGNTFGLTRERARQIEASLIKRLKTLIKV